MGVFNVVGAYVDFLQDRTIAVWDMKTPKDVVLRRVLVGHRAAVNVVDFDERYIVSASGDRTIKVSLSHSAFMVLANLRAGCSSVRVWLQCSATSSLTVRHCYLEAFCKCEHSCIDGIL